MSKINFSLLLSIILFVPTNIYANTYWGLVEAQKQINNLRSGDLLQLIQTKYQNSKFIPDRCIGALLYLNSNTSDEQLKKATAIYRKLWKEGETDLAFYVNLWRMDNEYRKNLRSQISIEGPKRIIKSAYLQYTLLFERPGEESKANSLSDGVTINPELSILFSYFLSDWMVSIYYRSIAKFYCEAVFLALEPYGTLRIWELWGPGPLRESLKEMLKESYSFLIKHFSIYCRPHFSKYTVDLIQDAFYAGVLYHTEEKEKALEIYTKLVKTEKERLKDFITELPQKKNKPGEWRWTSIRLNKNYADFVLLQAMYGRMVEILVELGRTPEAKEAIKQGHELFPESARLYCIEAGILVQQENLAQARSLYEKALTVNVEYIHAYLGLSRLDLIEKKDSYELLDRCTKVIEFEGPESEWTTQALDLMLQRLKRE